MDGGRATEARHSSRDYDVEKSNEKLDKQGLQTSKRYFARWDYKRRVL
jgi:hypothetical protein